MYIIKTDYSGNSSYNHVKYQVFKGNEKFREGTDEYFAELSRGESCLYTLKTLIDSLPNDVEVTWEHDDTLDIFVDSKNPELKNQKEEIKQLIENKGIDFK